MQQLDNLQQNGNAYLETENPRKKSFYSRRAWDKTLERLPGDSAVTGIQDFRRSSNNYSCFLTFIHSLKGTLPLPIYPLVTKETSRFSVEQTQELSPLLSLA